MMILIDMAEEIKEFWHPVARKYRTIEPEGYTPLGTRTIDYKGDNILIYSYLNKIKDPVEAVVGREHDRRLNESDVTISKVSHIKDENEKREIEQILRSEGVKSPIYFW